MYDYAFETEQGPVFVVLITKLAGPFQQLWILRHGKEDQGPGQLDVMCVGLLSAGLMPP